MNSQRDKILFISHRIPFPPNKGDKIRSFHELVFLSKFYDIDLVTFYDDYSDKKYVDTLKQYCKSVHVFHRHPQISLINGLLSLLKGKTISAGCYQNKKTSKAIENLYNNNNYLFIFCYSSQVAQYAIHSNIPKIIDFIDVDSDKWRQYAINSIQPMKIVYNTEFRRLALYEKEIYNQFTLSLFSTNQELSLFKKNDIFEKLAVLSNGVNHEFFSPQYLKREKALIFTGAMDYFPNIDAVLWFCKNIFPSVLAKQPDVKFYIVGSNPVQKIRKLASDNVIVTGFVDDIRNYIARAALAVFPLRIARGIQNKILEAMSMGITPLIPYNLKYSLDEKWPDEVLIYKDEKECVDHILNTLRSFKSDDPPSISLRQYIIDHRDWNKRLHLFHDILLKHVMPIEVEETAHKEVVTQ